MDSRGGFIYELVNTPTKQTHRTHSLRLGNNARLDSPVFLPMFQKLSIDRVRNRLGLAHTKHQIPNPHRKYRYDGHPSTEISTPQLCHQTRQSHALCMRAPRPDKMRRENWVPKNPTPPLMPSFGSSLERKVNTCEILHRSQELTAESRSARGNWVVQFIPNILEESSTQLQIPHIPDLLKNVGGAQSLRLCPSKTVLLVPDYGLQQHRVTKVECATCRARLDLFNVVLRFTESALAMKQLSQDVISPEHENFPVERT